MKMFLFWIRCCVWAYIQQCWYPQWQEVSDPSGAGTVGIELGFCVGAPSAVNHWGISSLTSQFPKKAFRRDCFGWLLSGAAWAEVQNVKGGAVWTN